VSKLTSRKKASIYRNFKRVKSGSCPSKTAKLPKASGKFPLEPRLTHPSAEPLSLSSQKHAISSARTTINAIKTENRNVQVVAKQ
jgi:hypothetical protein